MHGHDGHDGPEGRALAAHPNIALTIDSAGTSAAAQSLLVRGTARLDTVDGRRRVPPGGCQDDGGSGPGRVEQSVRATYEQMVRISVTLAWARFFDFEVGRLPRHLEEDVTG